MNSFAQPEEASSYEFPEFPRPEDQPTEYANLEGAVEYKFRDVVTQEIYSATNDTPVVYPAVFQDFKQILQS